MEKTIFEIVLKDFSFPGPQKLKNNHANFRFVVDLRFIDDKGEPKVIHTMLPSVANFWECDTGEWEKLNFVRKQDGHDKNKKPKFLPKFDMDKVGDWDKMIFWVRAQSLKAIRFRVYDVNREDWWDKFAGVLKAIPRALGAFLGPVVGVAEEASSALIEKTYSKSKLLFQGTKNIDLGLCCICGDGYQIKFCINKNAEAATNSASGGSGDSQ